MKFSRSGHDLADLKLRDWHKFALAVLIWPAISGLIILASLAFAVPATKAIKADLPLDYRCEYTSADPKKGEERWRNFFFDPGIPYDFIDMFAFDHTIRTTVVTDDQVVKQWMLFDNASQPDRPTAISFTGLNRHNLAFRPHTARTDPRTRERKVASDRSGLCVLATGRKAR